MKIRIGYGLGTQGLSKPESSLGLLVDSLERFRFDSLWLSERVTGPAPDPLVGMSFAAGRTRRLKLGTSVMVLPGRNPALLAKELATLDRLSNGRLLPAFGLGQVSPREQAVFGVAREERASLFDEMLPLIRRFWAEESVDHDGPHYRYESTTIEPHPAQQPLEVWLGGRAPSELRRVGRLGDGWLPSFCTPESVTAGRSVVEEEAARHDRSIDPEHWGALVPYTLGSLPDGARELIARRVPADVVDDIVPQGIERLRSLLAEFTEAGFSKFVLVPVAEPPDWERELGELAASILTMQT